MNTRVSELRAWQVPDGVSDETLLRRCTGSNLEACKQVADRAAHHFQRLSAQVHPVEWSLYLVTNGAFFWVPRNVGHVTLACAGTKMELSGLAAGLVACLLAASDSASESENEGAIDAFCELLDFASTLPEYRFIYQMMSLARETHLI